MFWNTKCEHPFAELRVWSDSTTTPSHIAGNTLVTHRLFCGKCGQKDLDIKYASSSTGLIDSVSPYEKAAEQRDPDDYLLVPTAFNGLDGHRVYVGPKGEIEFRTPKGKLDFQTIESVTARMTKQDVQDCPELVGLCNDVIRFAIKRKNGEI
jgi:hypothetical protein